MSTFIDFQELKEKISIESVVAMLQLNLNTSGKQLRGTCPIHQGSDSKEFVVTPEKGLFYCFKCKEGGDMIALYARVKNIDQKIAAQEIATSAAVSIDSNTVESPELINTEIFSPLTYLVSEHDLLQELGLISDTYKKVGAGYAPKGVLRGRLALPIHDFDGNLLGYCGYRLKGEGDRLSFPKGFDPTGVIFNAHRCERQSHIDLRHDPLDVLLAFQGGVETNVISFLTEEVNGAQLNLLASLLTRLESHL